MSAFRSSGVVITVAVAALVLAAPLWAQVGGPLDIVPQAPEPPAETPPPGAEPEAATAPVATGVEVDTVEAVDPEAVGLIEEAEGGFGFEMWQSTPRWLVERVLPQLPVATTSRTMNDLARRLLLTTAAPPEGPRSANLLALRVERLAAMGEGVATIQMLRAAPPNLHDRVLARARLDALLLTADYAGACVQARDLIRRDEAPYWEKVLIFCRALAGQHDAAAFGVALLRERGADEDAAFLALLQAMAGDSEASLTGLHDLKALHLAMLNAARAPVPEAAVSTANPAIARAIALSANAPLDLRLRAAERAEAMGALPVETLAELYAGVPFTTEDLANPLSRARTDKGPVTRALLYQAVATQVVPAARAEVLQACWRLGREGGGWDGFATAARVNLEALLALAPSPELVWIAGDAVRALFAAGRPLAARAWLELAAAQASANAEAAAATTALWPLAKLADADGTLPWDAARLAAWRDAQAEAPKAERKAKATVLHGLLVALGEEVPPDAELDLLEGPLRQWTKTLAPVLWHRLEVAAAEGRVGETVLLALVALDPTTAIAPGPLALTGALTALRRVGLSAEARALALEVALARDL